MPTFVKLLKDQIGRRSREEEIPFRLSCLEFLSLPASFP